MYFFKTVFYFEKTTDFIIAVVFFLILTVYGMAQLLKILQFYGIILEKHNGKSDFCKREKNINGYSFVLSGKGE